MTEEGSGLEEIGFNWGEYLEETGASAAPHTSFKHVRHPACLSGLHSEGGKGHLQEDAEPLGRKGKSRQEFLEIKRGGQPAVRRMGLVLALDLFR